MITDEEIDREIAVVRERDIQTGSVLRTEGDDEAGIETIVTGEKIPVIGYIDAARIILIHIRDLDQTMVAIGG